MKYDPIFEARLRCANADEVFAYLIDQPTTSIKGWDYFVNWSKVQTNIAKIEMDLHLLDYLIGKADIEAAFKDLLRRHPTVIELIPILLAIKVKDRTSQEILIDLEKLQFEQFFFTAADQLSETAINDAYQFALQTGLLDIFEHKHITNIRDYVFGVEVGLDTNARKNRGGAKMEILVENYLTTLCETHNYELRVEASVSGIAKKFDFVVKSGNTLYLLETNYYGGGGSKLNATARDYQTLHDLVASQGHHFIWITDGFGWKTSRNALNEAFHHLDYILNLKMIAAGILEHIIVNRL